MRKDAMDTRRHRLLGADSPSVVLVFLVLVLLIIIIMIYYELLVALLPFSEKKYCNYSVNTSSFFAKSEKADVSLGWEYRAFEGAVG